MQSPDATPSFFSRFKLATRVLTDAALARQVAATVQGTSPSAALAPTPTPSSPASIRPPVTVAATAPAAAARPTADEQASGLAVLALLQREGRLIDFLQEEVAAFSDAEIGAAARVVHAGSRKVLQEYLTLEPVLKDAEGAVVTLKAGFDAQRVRLTGNVSGQPPFRGTLKHHGWIATEVRLPAVAAAFDARVIAPAEVEL